MTALPESKAAARLASMVATHLDPAWLTDAALCAVMSKLVAAPSFVRQVLDDLEQDPKAIGQRGEVLKQARTASFSDEDVLLEELHQAEQDVARLRGLLAAKGSVYVDRFDPDERGADEDSDRIGSERAADKAAANAPRVRAS